MYLGVSLDVSFVGVEWFVGVLSFFLLGCKGFGEGGWCGVDEHGAAHEEVGYLAQW